MLGAVAGDIIGSVYEWNNIKTTTFPLFSEGCSFTDDSVLTIATAHALLEGLDYTEAYQRWGWKYPNSGYGGRFSDWLRMETPRPYDSWGNGSGMRVSPVAWARDSSEEVLAEAEKSAAVTHNHPEGIKGAQAIALATFLARTGVKKEDIRKKLQAMFESYDLSRTTDVIRRSYAFDVSCQGSVPESLIAFFESESFEDCIRRAVSIGGDTDTIACMAGAVADAYYGGVPEDIAGKCEAILADPLLESLQRFEEKFVTPRRR